MGPQRQLMGMTGKSSSPSPASDLNMPFVVIWAVIREVREPESLVSVCIYRFESTRRTSSSLRRISAQF
jgi:hypothetical protein